MAADAPPPGPGRGPKSGSGGTSATKISDTKSKVGPPKYYFHARRILDVVVIVCAVFTLLFARLFRPGFWSTLVYALVSLPAGVVLSFIYYSRKRSKDDVRKLVRYGLTTGSYPLTPLYRHDAERGLPSVHSASIRLSALVPSGADHRALS
jgi:hypothetical protein